MLLIKLTKHSLKNQSQMKNKSQYLSLVFFIILVVTISSCRKDKVFSEYDIKEFTFQGHEAKIVFPHKSNEKRYWLWRARFWGLEPQVDKALLKNGFHIVYVDVSNLYGNRQAVNLWNDFYNYIVPKYNLNSKVVLEGMSRGGLIIYNWAAQNTDKVSCIYADAPVCDIKSWPGGLFNGIGSPGDWRKCLKAYNLDENSVLEFDGIPINTAINVAKAKIPVIHVYGDADKVVPYEENTMLLARNYKEAGGKIVLIVKQGVGHNPHSLEDPKPIIDFILKNTTKKGIKSLNK